MNTKKFQIVFGVGSIGIILSMILYEMNSRGIIIDEFITGSITITNLMAGVIILFVLLAVIIGSR